MGIGAGVGAAAKQIEPAGRDSLSSRRGKCQISRMLSRTRRHRIPRNPCSTSLCTSIRDARRRNAEELDATIQPGNSINGSSQGKRRGRQKRSACLRRSMDHSYRVANGNVADGPPSAIPPRATATAAATIPTYLPGSRPPSPTRPRASSVSLRIFSSSPRFRGNRAQARRQGGVHQGRK